MGGSAATEANDPILVKLREQANKRIKLSFERNFMFFLPRICEHCLNPSCMASCPSGAIYKRSEDGIVLVDQHAAHERLVYEALKGAMEARALPSQMLLLPEIVDLPEDDAERLSAHAEALLFAAARADHVEKVIRPAIGAGIVGVLAEQLGERCAGFGRTSGIAGQPPEPGSGLQVAGGSRQGPPISASSTSQDATAGHVRSPSPRWRHAKRSATTPDRGQLC